MLQIAQTIDNSESGGAFREIRGYDVRIFDLAIAGGRWGVV